MLEPQGPLPPEIYWRRRALAVGVVVLALIIVIGLIIWASGGSNESPRNTSASASSSASLTSAPSSADASESIAGGSGGSGSGGSGGNGVPGQTPASGSVASGVVPGASSSSVAPTAVPASGLCPDQNISAVLYTDKPTYTVGEKPVFTIVVTNAGLTECTRDVGKDMQNVTVRSLDGTRYIWSATDCSPINTINNQLLKPAQQFKDTIVWSGTSSTPGCKTPRRVAAAGPYQAIGSLGEKQSAPITFNFTDPPAQ